MSDSLLFPGSLVQFSYPRHNFKHVRRTARELRRVRVTAVRDLRDEPLDGDTPMFEPKLARGTILVTGYDLDRHAERSFYVESMNELRPLDLRVIDRPPLRAAIVRDGELRRFTEMPDPRAGFCRAFNSLGMDEVAVPA
jgi:hypothetical protein